jgi:signal transduction histidine kinase
MDDVNTDRAPNAGDRDRSIAAVLALVATAVLLVALALVGSGSVQITAVITLGFLGPIAALVASTVERRVVGRRLTTLENTIQSGTEARRNHDELFTRFIDELRAPLTAVYGLSEHLREAGIADAAETEDLIEIISRDANEIVRTIENTSIAAQIDTGRYRPKPVVVQLDHEIIWIIEALRGTSIEIAVDARQADVWCDPAAIRLMLLNVLHTAADDGASTARIDVAERNGLGIISITDDRRRNHITVETPADQPSSGITLSSGIVPAVVESQGGTVSSARTLGWSNTVIRLPLATPAQLTELADESNSITESP